jgi:hypothetical protein
MNDYAAPFASPASEPAARPRSRAALLKRLADVVCLPASRINAFERAMTADLLVEMLRDAVVEEREKVARRLANLTEMPGVLVRLLLRDELPVARGPAGALARAQRRRPDQLPLQQHPGPSPADRPAARGQRGGGRRPGRHGRDGGHRDPAARTSWCASATRGWRTSSRPRATIRN